LTTPSFCLVRVLARVCLPDLAATESRHRLRELSTSSHCPPPARYPSPSFIESVAPSPPSHQKPRDLVTSPTNSHRDRLISATHIPPRQRTPFPAAYTTPRTPTSRLHEHTVQGKGSVAQLKETHVLCASDLRLIPSPCPCPLKSSTPPCAPSTKAAARRFVALFCRIQVHILRHIANYCPTQQKQAQATLNQVCTLNLASSRGVPPANFSNSSRRTLMPGYLSTRSSSPPATLRPNVSRRDRTRRTWGANTRLDIGLQILDNVIMTRWRILPREQCQGG
jgi:hypothetical protein